ncbi:ATP-dependent DNA ligase [Streptomyces longispororuber]|uniref:ATP-dependent DNA ligase n=1 Tax=Streptomyces longispororuber TaxID=68230 RepID=UPI001E5A674A|nr:ATP-dependent DNA ligase [Streptomyces longispororuber]
MPEPILTTAVDSPELPPGHAAEIKWDGFRAGLSLDARQVVLRSRNGTQMAPAFPEIVAAAAQLPDASALDGELIVWESGRLAFERLQDRLRRRGAAAARAAEQWPAHFVAFDLLRLSGTSTTGWSYRRRRAALEQVFADRGLGAPWALCPSTTDPAMVREWLTWTTATGLEGVLFKPLDSLYRPGVRGVWKKYKPRETTEALVGAVTGSAAAPRTLLLGCYDKDGCLHYTGRTTTLSHAAGQSVAAYLTPASDRDGHPWAGWSFSAGWGSTRQLEAVLVEPELAVEVSVDVARDASGRWRHPARWHRARPDLSPADVPRWTSPR